MLNYQSTSFYDALYIRDLLNLQPAPEFERWLSDMGLMDDHGQMHAIEQLGQRHRLLGAG